MTSKLSLLRVFADRPATQSQHTFDVARYNYCILASTEHVSTEDRACDNFRVIKPLYTP
jgi:hypothetical protein